MTRYTEQHWLQLARWLARNVTSWQQESPHMLATLARCVPQDLVNPFVSAAILPTIGVASLTALAGALWLWRVLVPRVRSARSIWIAVPATIAIFPLAAVTLWIWLQARSFIPWCAPIDTSVLDAQYHSATVVLVVGFVACAFSILVIMGSSIAATIAGLRRN
jgi:hypothetical protein